MHSLFPVSLSNIEALLDEHAQSSLISQLRVIIQLALIAATVVLGQEGFRGRTEDLVMYRWIFIKTFIVTVQPVLGSRLILKGNITCACAV